MACVSFVACVVISAPPEAEGRRRKGKEGVGKEGERDGVRAWNAKVKEMEKEGDRERKKECWKGQWTGYDVITGEILQCIKIYNIIVRILGQIPHHTTQHRT
jgi:hypothetical protein